MSIDYNCLLTNNITKWSRGHYLYLMIFNHQLVIQVQSICHRFDRQIGEKGHHFSQHHVEAVTYHGPTAEIHYKIRVICDKDFYGDTCTQHCVARDDIHGHYKCNHNGDKICKAGWTGKYCDQGIWAFVYRVISFTEPFAKCSLNFHFCELLVLIFQNLTKLFVRLSKTT